MNLNVKETRFFKADETHLLNVKPGDTFVMHNENFGDMKFKALEYDDTKYSDGNDLLKCVYIGDAIKTVDGGEMGRLMDEVDDGFSEEEKRYLYHDDYFTWYPDKDDVVGLFDSDVWIGYNALAQPSGEVINMTYISDHPAIIAPIIYIKK